MQNIIQNKLQNADDIGEEEFLKAFFRPNEDLSNFYRNDSILSFQDERIIGKDDIVGKLKSIQVFSIPTDFSIQPTDNGIFIYSCGKLKVSGGQKLFPFTRCFVLVNNADLFYIKNEIYKIFII